MSDHVTARVIVATAFHRQQCLDRAALVQEFPFLVTKISPYYDR